MIFSVYDKAAKSAIRLYLNEKRQLFDFKVGIASGCYDLFHFYHLRYLERCRNFLGEDGALIVGVDSDTLVKSVKGDSRPIYNEIHRMAIVDACKHVTAVFLMNSVKDHVGLVDFLKPDYVFKNQCYRKMCGSFYEESQPDEVYTGKAELVIIPDIDEVLSTSDFIRKIKQDGKNK